MIPDLEAAALPKFDEAERSVLADDIKAIAIGYFGRDAGAARTTPPTWRERWDDPHRLPLLIRIDVTPAKARSAWPHAPRRAAAGRRGRLPGVGHDRVQRVHGDAADART